jgi:hypothetical protein
MNKNIIVLISLLPVIGLAEEAFFTASPTNAQKGIVVVPLAQTEHSKERLSFIKQQKMKGYIEKEENGAKELIAMGQGHLENEINNTADPQDTHLKTDFSAIKLAFKFEPISFIQPIGFAVGGVYLDDLGWTAISTFFNDDSLGVCSYKLNNMAVSNGAVMVPQEMIIRDVNDKMTDIFVEGSVKSGFVYHVNWSDDIYNHFFECGKMSYDKKTINMMVDFAKRIDRAVVKNSSVLP